MREKGSHRLIWGLLALAIAVVVGNGIWALTHPQNANLNNFKFRDNFERGGSRLSDYGIVPYFSLANRDRRAISLSDLKSKVWIADFIFTNCPDECPLMSRRLAELQAEFQREKELQLVSFSIDPLRDTLETLSQYADQFGADPRRWLFLSGGKDEIYRLAQNGFHLSVAEVIENRGSSEVRTLTHSNRFVLVDYGSRIRGYYNSTDESAIQQLRQDVRSLLKPK